MNRMLKIVLLMIFAITTCTMNHAVAMYYHLDVATICKDERGPCVIAANAVRKGHLDCLRFLSRNGSADAWEDLTTGETALEIAAKLEGSEEALRILLKEGARTDHQPNPYSLGYGATALHVAVIAGILTHVQILVSYPDACTAQPTEALIARYKQNPGHLDMYETFYKMKPLELAYRLLVETHDRHDERVKHDRHDERVKIAEYLHAFNPSFDPASIKVPKPEKTCCPGCLCS